MPALGLYLNGINSDPAFRDLDHFLYNNVADLKAFGQGLSAAMPVPDVLIRLGREDPAHRTSSGGPEGLGEEFPLWTGVRDFTLVELIQHGLVPLLGSVPADGEMLSIESVASFVLDLRQKYQGALSIVLGGHGGGPRIVVAWEELRFMRLLQSGPDAVHQPSALPAVAPPTYLTPGGLCAGLARGGVTTSDKLEMIAMDACQDATIELAVELSDYAQFMCASEVTIPLSGWNYKDWPKAYFSEPNSVGRTASVVNSYAAHYSSVGRPGSPHSLTAIDLGQMGLLTAALRQFSDFVLNDRTLIRSLVAARRMAPSVPASSETIVDAITFFKCIAISAKSVGLQRLAKDVIAAMVAAIGGRVWADAAAQSTASATGLSITFPANISTLDPAFWQFYYLDTTELRKFKSETNWHKVVAQCLAAMP